MQTFGKLVVELASGAAEEFCDWARGVWEVEPVWFERPGAERAVIEVYFEDVAAVGGRMTELQEAWGGRFLAARAEAVPEEDWTTFWRHHFKIQDLGERLRIVPVWERAPDRKRINLWMDPGLSFGTGDHFTTRFCLEELERAWVELEMASFLDAGTGSGILAIAAARLGVPKVEGFDFDPVCVAGAAHNARLNRLPKGRIEWYEADVLQEGWRRGTADVVCANILTGVLVAAREELWRATGRRLIVTGIREDEGAEVEAAFGELGAKLIRRAGDGEWCGLVLERG